MTISRLVNRNVVAERGRTSMRLEPELWDMLNEICEREAQDMSTLVRQIEAAGQGTQEAAQVRSGSISRTTSTLLQTRSGMQEQATVRSSAEYRS